MSLFPFYNLWKDQKITDFFDVFRGYKKETLTQNGSNNYNIGESGTILYCISETLVAQS